MGPLLVGPGLGSSQKYIHHASEYTKTIPVWTAMKSMLPPSLRAVSFWILPIGKTIRHHLRETKRLVVPEIKRLIETTPVDGTPFSMLEGLIKLALRLDRKEDLDEILNQILFILFAGADLIAVVLCQLIYRVLAHPEYIPELQAEIETALRDSPSQTWDKNTLEKMPKLDSFIRETLRLSPPISCTVQRKAMQDVQLSNGVLLKTGSNVMLPTHAILRDPDIYEKPETFNPYRFVGTDKDDSRIGTVTQTADYSMYVLFITTTLVLRVPFSKTNQKNSADLDMEHNLARVGSLGWRQRSC
ncbi:hypothetical protein NHQ30_007459 [Ciborinia camelliae]|nr:hypothetical protein NHQ30_007459 [Ciborinia camelliae]